MEDTMKFLTLLKFKPLPPDPKMTLVINEGAKAWIKAHLSDGALDCAYNVLPNAPGYYGLGISNAASLEALFQLLTTYPAYAITDFEVYPLSEVYSAIDNVSDAVRKMMG
jgi:hypothetical protein